MNTKEEEFAYIHANSGHYPVTHLIAISSVSRSGYYQWVKREGGYLQERKDAELYYYVSRIFDDHKGTYGRGRIKIELKRRFGMNISEKRVSKIMRKYGLQCRIRRKKTNRNYQPHGDVPNLLERNFKAVKPGVKFAIDITYVEATKGFQKWVYACAIKDLFNGEIVGYSTGVNQTIKLVFNALDQLKQKGFVKGAILHSDQGTQFTNRSYKKYLSDMGLTQSMSRRANCLDNASIENFFGHLKVEMECFEQPETVHEVKGAIARYINYYNLYRVQTKLQAPPIEYRLTAA